jgi:hypothetical protein
MSVASPTGSSPIRLRLLTVLVTLGCVVLATIGIRVSDTDDNFQLVRGRVGRAVSINEGSVTVDDLRVGRSLVQDKDVVSTPGLFVAVRVTASAPGKDQLVLGSSQLSSGDRVYLPYSSASTISVDPGFSMKKDLLYEVDPNRIDDLTLDLWQGEIVVGYHQRIRIPLGVTHRNAGEVRASAQHPIVQPNVNGSSSAIP